MSGPGGRDGTRTRSNTVTGCRASLTLHNQCSCSGGPVRTVNLALNRRLLYQLSYLGMDDSDQNPYGIVISQFPTWERTESNRRCPKGLIYSEPRPTNSQLAPIHLPNSGRFNVLLAYMALATGSL
jgi:hypothetical protein